MLTLILALSAPAMADTLDVALGDKQGVVRIPSSKSVTLEMEGKEAKESWTNTDGDALSMTCGEAKAPEDTFVEQLLLSVGDEKWALAPGASLKLTCGDKPVVFTDVHGTEVAKMPGPVKATVASVKDERG